MTNATPKERQHAEELWNDLRNAFLKFKDILKQIIDEQAWIPLGYSTFAEAWKDRMSDITLAIEIRPHVVYQLFDEKLSNEEVAETVKGVGPKGAEYLRQQKENGVPANQASRQRSVSRRSNRTTKDEPKVEPQQEQEPKTRNEATIVVGPYAKDNSPVDQYAIHVEFTAETIAEWHQIAAANGTTLKAIAKSAIENVFTNLARLAEREAS